MIFRIPRLIEHVSSIMTLEEGDLLLTGDFHVKRSLVPAAHNALVDRYSGRSRTNSCRRQNHSWPYYHRWLTAGRIGTRRYRSYWRLSLYRLRFAPDTGSYFNMEVRLNMILLSYVQDRSVSPQWNEDCDGNGCLSSGAPFSVPCNITPVPGDISSTMPKSSSKWNELFPGVGVRPPPSSSSS